MGILDLRGIQPRERKHFLDKRDHPGSFLLNIQQMFIVPAHFRREKFGIGADDGEWSFQLMTGIGNKFFLGKNCIFNGFYHPSRECFGGNGKYDNSNQCEDETEKDGWQC